MPLRTDLVSGAECDRVAWSHHAATEAMGQSNPKQISARTIPARCCEAKKNRDAPALSQPLYAPRSQRGWNISQRPLGKSHEIDRVAPAVHLLPADCGREHRNDRW